MKPTEKKQPDNTKSHERDAQHASRYGSSWQHVRSAYVSSHPLYERCARQGRYVPVEEVHRIVPLKDGGDNLISLCRKCHAEVHAEMGTRNHDATVYEMDDSHHI